MKKILFFVLAVFVIGTAHATCTPEQIDVNGDGTVCETPKFTLTTNTTTSFDFSLSAVGTFTVDCGDGGTLTSSVSPTDVSNGTTITRNNTTVAKYTCTWSSAGAHTILFDGTATNYNGNESTPAISFYVGADDTAKAANAAKIASISGNLSAIFPYISGNAANGAQPRFYQTFGSATSLTSIPATLFADYTAASTYMFYGTFYGCNHLTSISENLFFPNAQSVSGAEDMFRSTFERCAGLTTLPSDLFSKITSGADYMFFFTFRDCTGLTTLPSDLFSKITSGADYMFRSTFYQCRGLRTIPSGLFFPNATNGVPGAYGMFHYTFYNCTGLTTLPSDLFSKITSGATNMFIGTFNNCTNLGCETAGCSTGTGYIPSTMFAGITPRGSNAIHTMNSTFTGTKLVIACPNGTIQYTTGWESYWGGNKVSCVPGCDAGMYSPSGSTSCSTCTANSFCPGFAATLDSSVAQGITACSTLGDNSYTQSIAGSDEDTDCYRSCSGNVTIAHATTITGNDYYGAGTDTCVATACDNGWHVDTGGCVGNEITINWHGALQSDIETNNAGTMIYGGDINTPVRPDPSQIPIGQRFKGWRFSKPSQN